MSAAVSKLSRKTLRVLHKGCIPYPEAMALQEALHAARLRFEVPDTLLLLEHPPVFTTGRQDVAADWLHTPDEIRSRGIDVVSTNRGGRITYHGPGQLVGYFICDLQKFYPAPQPPPTRGGGISIPDFVRWIEAGLISVLAQYGIAAHRDEDHPGVWVGENKLAAIGLHVRHGVTLHGFALNVTTDLTPYSYCVPCGIRDRSVTSLNALRPHHTWSLKSVAQDVGDYFSSMAANVGPEPSICSSTNIGHSSA